MSSVPILIWSHYRSTEPSPFAKQLAAGEIREVWEGDVTERDFAETSGVVTTMHLDQIRASNWQRWFSALLARGGRVAINGHVVRPFIEGLNPYIPAEKCGRSGLALTVLADHPIFDGVDRVACGVRRGVAGFYGRGHNPLPNGATALTGVGPALAPLDWVWHRPEGGAVFSHAGNDLWGIADGDVNTRLIANLATWVGETRPVA